MSPLRSLLVAPRAPPLCAACGAWAGRVEPLCPDCRAGLRRLAPAIREIGGVAVWAPVAYEGPARELVHALKFRGVRLAAAVMAAQIAASAPPGLLSGDALVPVPLHRSRLRRRAFNQAALLAGELAHRAGLPVWDGLARRGRAGTQVGRGRAARAAGVAGAFALREGVRPPARAVLVDDVVTTGATLAACAAALRAAGAERVAAVAYARTPGR